MKNTLLPFVFILQLSIISGQESNLQSITDQYHREMNFNGVVLVATNGKIDQLACAGLADRASEQKITVKSRFKIASMTKVFTALLVMKLYEDGKIKLDETIGKYFPEYPGEGRDQVTIHHLLTYASGIEDQTDPLGMKPFQVRKSLDQFIDEYCSGKLTAVPGEKSVYGNTEYIILQKIIENVSGKSYEIYLRDIILRPLQMNNTGLVSADASDQNLSTSYSYDVTSQTFTPDVPYYGENYFAAGNLYSTAEDLLALNNAIFQNKILSQKTTQKMLEIHENLGYTAYGFWGSAGWGNFAEPFYYRTGGILGSTSNWINTMTSKKTIIILSNTDASNLYEMSERLYLAGLKKN